MSPPHQDATTFLYILRKAVRHDGVTHVLYHAMPVRETESTLKQKTIVLPIINFFVDDILKNLQKFDIHSATSCVSLVIYTHQLLTQLFTSSINFSY